MLAGTYVVTAKLGEQEVASDKIEVKDQEVSEIKILTSEVLTGKSATYTSGNDDLAYVYYDVVDQYGISVKASEEINWTTSPNYIKDDKSNGVLTIQDKEGFTYGSNIFVTGVHVKSGKSVSTSVKVGASRNIDAVEFAGFIAKSNKTKLLTELPSDFKANEYLLLYRVKDQNGMPIDIEPEDAENITFINNQPTLIDSDMKKEASLYTVDGEEYAAISIEPGLYVDKGGEVTITAISNKTGKKTDYVIQVGEVARLSSFEIGSPSGIVADGDGCELPFTALGTDGKAITKYESIVRTTNTLNLTASVGTLTLTEQQDGTAKLYWTDAIETGDYANNAKASGMSSTFDGQSRNIALTAIVVGGTSSNKMLAVSDMRYPAGISSVEYDTTVVKGATGDAQVANGTIKFTDQYGAALDKGIANKFFTYAETDTFDGKYYALKATSKDTKLMAAKEEIVSGAGITFSWKAGLNGAAGVDRSLAATYNNGTGDVEFKADSSTVKYTIISKENKADAAWTDASQSKSVTSVIVPISDVKNLALAASGTIVIQTSESGNANGAKLAASVQESKLGAGITDTQVKDKVSYSVTGKYNGTSVKVPDAYVATTAESAYTKADGLVVSNAALAWKDLYDFNTYNNPRKDAQVDCIVSVEGGDILSAEDDTTLSDKITVSDAKPALTNISFSRGPNSNPYKTEMGNMNWYVGVKGTDQWGDEVALTAKDYKFEIKDIEEADTEFTHLANSFTVSGNGTSTVSVEGAELGDKFTLVATLTSNGNSCSKEVTVTPDQCAKISSDSTDTNVDSALRKVLGYNR